MWNGVEAVHMYMTLVKVFTAHASYFVLKAGLVAWGKGFIASAVVHMQAHISREGKGRRRHGAFFYPKIDFPVSTEQAK